MRKLAWILALLLLAGPAAASEKTKIAVLAINAPEQMDKHTVKLLDELLLTAIQEAGELEVFGAADIASMISLEEERVKMTGCADDSCLAEIGGALGVNLLVASSVGQIGKKHLINIKLLDVSSAKVLHRATEVVEGDQDTLIGAIQAGARKLMAGAGYGSAGAQPADAGAGPPADEGSASGATGPEAGETTATPATTTEAAATATAEVEPEAGFITVAPWITLGLAGALAIAGGVTVGLGMSDYSAMEDEFEGSDAWDELNDSADTRMIAGEVLIGIGLAAGVTTLILFLVGPDEEAPAASVVPVRGGAAATVGWTFDLGVRR